MLKLNGLGDSNRQRGIKVQKNFVEDCGSRLVLEEFKLVCAETIVSYYR